MIVYGRNAVREALRGRRSASVSSILASESAAREPWLDGRSVQRANAAEIERACGSPEHQGVCATVDEFPYVRRGRAARIDRFVLALDEVQDPQNLGALCRTAECAGVSGVVICERRAAAVSAAVCRASAGAVEHLRIARVRNLADFLDDAKRAGCWCYGAAADERGGSVRAARLLRGRRTRARSRGTRAASPCRGELRRADRAPATRPRSSRSM